jgi:hypothetical protein
MNKKEIAKIMHEFTWGDLEKLVEELYNPLTCPNCLRRMPNLQFKRNKGCKWCIR